VAECGGEQHRLLSGGYKQALTFNATISWRQHSVIAVLLVIITWDTADYYCI
jgi:hypothetical protein